MRKLCFFQVWTPVRRDWSCTVLQHTPVQLPALHYGGAPLSGTGPNLRWGKLPWILCWAARKQHLQMASIDRRKVLLLFSQCIGKGLHGLKDFCYPLDLAKPAFTCLCELLTILFSTAIYCNAINITPQAKDPIWEGQESSNTSLCWFSDTRI